MLELILKNVVPKPAGKIFTNPSTGKSWITMGHEWQNSKAAAIEEVQAQLPPDHKPFNRIVGLVARISLKPNYKGHRKDLGNLINFPLDVFTQAGVWVDDCESVFDSMLTWISRNNSGTSTVWICENYQEYIDTINQYQATLRQLDIMTKNS